MCLSNVYIEEKTQDKLVLEEAEQVKVDGEYIQVRTLFGESKRLEGYYISEVNLMENYVILRKSGEHGRDG